MFPQIAKSHPKLAILEMALGKAIDEVQAREVAVEFVKKQEYGAQAEVNSSEREDIWFMDVSWPVRTEKLKGTQYAKVTVSGSGEVTDFEKTEFRGASIAQRIISKLRDVFSPPKPIEVIRTQQQQ